MKNKFREIYEKIKSELPEDVIGIRGDNELYFRVVDDCGCDTDRSYYEVPFEYFKIIDDLVGIQSIDIDGIDGVVHVYLKQKIT